MAGQLTTHVLDIEKGCPAGNLKIELWAFDQDGNKTLLKTVFTNADGRTDEPLLRNGEVSAGFYELVFSVGNYFSQSTKFPFLDLVPIRFGISEADQHYHVPLLVSPWAYSTYRGS